MVMNARQIIPLFACGIFIFGVTWCLLASPVHAADCGGVSTAILSSDACGTSEQGPMLGILAFTIKLLTGLIGIAAIGAIIYAGILYSSADNAKTQKSKSIITSTVIGIVLFAGMAAMLNWLVPGGVFSDNPSSWSQGTSAQPGSTTGTGGGSTASTGGSSGTPSTGGAGGTAVTGPTRITLASWNTYVNNPNKVGPIAASLLGSADVIGLQEVHHSDQRSSVKSIASSSIGVFFAPTPSSGDKHMASYPILYNKTKLSIISSGHQRLGSVPGLSDRYAVYIKFKVKATNQQFYFVNTHLPPSVEAGGEPSNNTSMKNAYKTLGSRLKSVVSGLQGSGIPLFLVGDFNVNFRRDNCSISWFPCALFKGINVRASFKDKLGNLSSSQGTHGTGSRLIDYVFLWARPGTTVDSISVLGGSGNGWRGSDHKPSISKITIQAPK